MADDTLDARLSELIKLAEAAPDLRADERLTRLPADTRLRIAALATTLGLDALLAQNTDVSLEQLREHSVRLQEFADDASRDMRTQLNEAASQVEP